MDTQKISFEQTLKDITRYIADFLRAEACMCYLESSAETYMIAASSGMQIKTFHECTIEHTRIDELFSKGFHPTLFSNSAPLFTLSADAPAKPLKTIPLLLYVPVVYNDTPVTVFEICNPGNDSIIRSKKSLKALHGLVQNIIQARLRLRSIEEVQTHEIETGAEEPYIIGHSKAITDLKAITSRIAATDSTVLLKGETGTGKNVVALCIHKLSSRRDMPFVKVNCAAIPENLLESELFGHEKGAFTGAFQRRMGRFERAHLGTIFLDEIGEISQNLQVKLLNVLHEQEFERLGGSLTIKVNTRIIAATNKDLEAAIARGEFREDLYYRLHVFPITIPPLRERIEDIEPLVRHFIKIIKNKLNMPYESISDETVFLLQKYHWPGNIRELENIIERAMVIGNGSVIKPPDLPQEIFGILDTVRQPKMDFAMRESLKSLWEVEKGIIERALNNLNWNQSKTARTLGITRNHLRYRIKKYRIVKPDPLDDTGENRP